MKDEVILKVENISKHYRLGTIGTGTISHDLNRFFARIRGKEDPYLKIGETNDRSKKGKTEYVWAIKDVNFELKRGEVLGIIGKNGAGKSTLLKILSKVTSPTTGSIKSKGRIASLLEVGTGFHPEMTGKENIFLNGAILGMTKKEIELKLDEIVAFSGCERYIDTPVKRYSSGMKVRLAFAVAAFLEPDILVVDEVLAVGDAEFQKKAIGKMQDISNTDGRTVLFVSHDMAAVKSLCNRGVLLENGKVKYIGLVLDTINEYLRGNLNVKSKGGEVNFNFVKDRTLSYIKLFNNEDKNTNFIFMGENLKLKIGVFNENDSKDIALSILIISSRGEKVAAIRSKESEGRSFSSFKNFEINVLLKSLNLMPGDYFLTIALALEGKMVDLKEEVICFTVHPKNVNKTSKIPKGNFINYFSSEWELKNI